MPTSPAFCEWPFCTSVADGVITYRTGESIPSCRRCAEHFGYRLHPAPSDRGDER